jgi:predicted ATPase
VVDDANRARGAEVVRLLDGLPLAIELAAARCAGAVAGAARRAHARPFRLLAGVGGAAARRRR